MTLTPKVEEKDRLSAIVNTRGALLGVLAAIVVVIGAAAAFLNYHETSAQNKRTNELTRHGQLADWFPKAIEELGKNNQDDRLGGIYALEQIAKEGRDLHPAVMEILTAFLRDQAARRRGCRRCKRALKLTDKPEASADMPESMLRLRTDFQAIATVLGRRESSYNPSGYTLDLRGAVLGGVDLTNAALEWADLGSPGSKMRTSREPNSSMGASGKLSSMRHTSLARSSSRPTSEAPRPSALTSLALMPRTQT